MDAPKSVYDDLLALVQDKDYFVLTTNVDHCFQKAGFDKRRIFYTQGDYGLFQCSVPCHNKTYDNKEIVRRTVGHKGSRLQQPMIWSWKTANPRKWLFRLNWFLTARNTESP